MISRYCSAYICKEKTMPHRRVAKWIRSFGWKRVTVWLVLKAAFWVIWKLYGPP